MRHTFETHSSEFNFSFLCRIDGCPRSFTTYSGFQSHVSRKHPVCQPPPPGPGISTKSGLSYTPPATFCNSTACNPNSQPTDSDNQDNQDNTLSDTAMSPSLQLQPDEHVKESAALFRLRMKEQYRLTQTSVDFVTSQVEGIISCVMEDVESKVRDSIQQQLPDAQFLPDFSSCFLSLNPFEGLETEHKQVKYFRESFNLVVS